MVAIQVPLCACVHLAWTWPVVVPVPLAGCGSCCRSWGESIAALGGWGSCMRGLPIAKSLKIFCLRRLKFRLTAGQWVWGLAAARRPAPCSPPLPLVGEGGGRTIPQPLLRPSGVVLGSTRGEPPRPDLGSVWGLERGKKGRGGRGEEGKGRAGLGQCLSSSGARFRPYIRFFTFN